MLFNSFYVYLILITLGLCMGSFAGASMWRLRARQLKQDKSDGESVDVKEYNHLKKIINKSILNDRSRCLSCSYVLQWYDLIPLISWISIKGKCRKCRKPIGVLEPIIELSMAVFFVASYLFWPYQLTNAFEFARLTLWLVAGVGLATLFAYDAKWFLLPDKVNFIVVGIGVANAVLILINSHDVVCSLVEIAGSVMVLSGLYLVIYLISKGKWIGFGDIKLGLGLGLMLADWKLAFVALFAANLIGCLIVIPLMLLKRLKRDSKVPFGPMLIMGYVFAGLFGYSVINFYFSFLI